MNQIFSDETRSIFTVGLRNAHAMENQALSIMKPQVDRIKNYPEMAARLQQHIEETNGQIRRLDTALEQLGESNSSLKDTALSMLGGIAAVGHSMADDEIIKNSFANFAFENYEIAAYNSLITLAEAGGFRDVTTLLEQNLEEEVAMADWIKSNLRNVTLRYARLSEAGATAKR